MFGLTEEVFLLSLYEKKKSVVISSNPAFPFALAGAILFELIILNKIKIEDGKRIALVEYELSDDKHLDGALDEILEVNKHKRITYWINVLGKRGRSIQRSLFNTMVMKKALDEEKEHHWVLPFPKESLTSGSAKFQLKTRLRNVVFGDESADQKSIAVFSLLTTCNLLGFVFTEDEIKAAKVKIDELVNRYENGAEVIENLRAIKSGIDTVMPLAYK